VVYLTVEADGQVQKKKKWKEDSRIQSLDPERALRANGHFASSCELTCLLAQLGNQASVENGTRIPATVDCCTDTRKSGQLQRWMQWLERQTVARALGELSERGIALLGVVPLRVDM
jgi:hypothetical protein